MNVTQNASDSVGAIACTHLFGMRADLNASFDSGAGPHGRRVLSSVAKGSFAGARLRGEIIPGTGDWMLTRHDG